MKRFWQGAKNAASNWRLLAPGIELRLLLLGVLPAAVIALSLATYFVRNRMTDLDRSLRDRGDVIVRQLATAAVRGIASEDRRLLQDLVTSVLQEDDVLEVTILDKARKPLASARRMRSVGNDGLRSPLRLTFSAPILVRNLEPSPGDETDRGFQEPVPIVAATEEIGNVTLSMSHDQTLQAQHDTLLFVVRITVAGLLLTAVFAYRIGRTISQPVLALTGTVHSLSKGHLHSRAEFTAYRELAELRDGFNAMARELERNRDTLEQQVADATQQLQQTLVDLERRNLELDAARRQAEAQTELKSQFLAQMSHEIRTPMNGIIGFTELLSQTQLNESQRSQVSLIERSARSLLGIINEVLDLSKLEAGRIALNPHEFQLRSYLEDAVSLVAPRSPRVPVVLWIHPDVPRRLFTDPVRLQQVLNNLLTNALKSTESGRVVVRVHRVAGHHGAALLFSVSDSGSGISARDMGSLFYPFLQLSRYAINQERGTGLGLTIARNIVERVGGSIHVASREGRGTTFWFTLPLTGHYEDSLPAMPPTQSVVLVDWDRLNAQSLGFQLGELGYRSQWIHDLAQWEAAAVPLGAVVLLNAGSLETRSSQPIAWWLRQVYARGATPLLILETVSQRQEAYYREQGAICISPPLRSETLKAALRVAQAADAPVNGEQSTANPPEQLFRDCHFLVADDNEINRMLLRAQLLKLGAEVDDARDGGEALEMLQIQPYDLVFLDLQMPVLHGLEVMDALKKEAGPNTHTPVIAITAHAQPEQRQSVIDRGFAECLIKPILERQVVEAASEILKFPATLPAEAGADRSESSRYSATLLSRSQGQHSLALEVARKLFEELPIQLTTIEQALERREQDEATRITHKVHGSASFCGLEELRRAAKGLESKLLEPKPWEGCETMFQGLKDEIGKLLAQRAEILKELESGLETS